MDYKFNENVPIYLQIINKIKGDIVSCKIKCREKLPSVRELSQILKINHNTIQRAYGELERQSIILYSKRNRSYVPENKKNNPINNTGFTKK